MHASQRIKAVIDRKALAHNLEVARRHAPQGKIVAVIKANAYGHGLIPVAEALRGADIYAVTDVIEADELRASGTNKDILILQGIIDRSEIRRITQQGYHVVIHRAQELEWLEQELSRVRIPKPLTLWLKLDTGMGRLGVKPGEVAAINLNLRRKPWVEDVVLMTHLANAATPDSALNGQQLLSFARCCQALAEFAPHTSIAASGTLLALDSPGDYARPGIMLYGSSPFPWTDSERRREKFDLRAAMSLQAKLISIQSHQTGDNIGYNSQFICPKPMRIGIVSAGYADGYPSATPNGCPVLVGTQRTVTTGRVSMDMLAIDLTDCAGAAVGDWVTLWDNNLSIDEVAAHTGVISYNLTSSLSPRVQRTYI